MNRSVIGYALVDKDGYIQRWSFPRKDPAIYAEKENAEHAADGCEIVPVYADRPARYAPMKKLRNQKNDE